MPANPQSACRKGITCARPVHHPWRDGGALWIGGDRDARCDGRSPGQIARMVIPAERHDNALHSRKRGPPVAGSPKTRPGFRPFRQRCACPWPALCGATPSTRAKVKFPIVRRKLHPPAAVRSATSSAGVGTDAGAPAGDVLPSCAHYGALPDGAVSPATRRNTPSPEKRTVEAPGTGVT